MGRCTNWLSYYILCIMYIMYISDILVLGIRHLVRVEISPKIAFDSFQQDFIWDNFDSSSAKVWNWSGSMVGIVAFLGTTA